MSEPFLAEIRMVGFNFAPRGWALCQGQLLPINANTALFSLLGTTFGGDGRTTFGLPDLRGRSMKGVGNGPGLSSVQWGEKGGRESVTLSVAELPSHNHTATLFAEDAGPTSGNPEGNMFASHLGYAPANESANRAMSSQSITVGSSGNNFPVDIKNPYLGLYICIAMEGLYPSSS